MDSHQTFDGSVTAGPWEPLRTATSFRIFRLLPPSRTNEHLRCELHNADLSDPPEYDAISYAWGDQTSATIDIDGMPCYISNNLAAALLWWRDESFHSKLFCDTFLWADSICINQENAAEKSQQVRQMGNIFRHALRVHIWLGQEQTNDQVWSAFDCMEMLLNKVYLTFDEFEVRKRQWLSQSASIRPTFEAILGIPAASSPDYEELWTFFKIPWFSRAWTYQESFVAQEPWFYWGPLRLPETVIVGVVYALFQLYDCTNDRRYWSSTISRSAIMQMDRHKGLEKPKSASLVELLCQRAGSQCKDPRDMIYSLLGAADDMYGIEPDYSKPFEEVYARCAWQIMKSTSCLEILGMFNDTERSSSLPRWVPDWREYRVHSSITNGTAPYQRGCTGSSVLTGCLSTDTRELVLRGLKSGQVLDLPLSAAGFQGWYTTHFPSQETYGSTGESIDNVLLHRMWCRDQTVWTEGNKSSRWTSASHQQVLDLYRMPRDEQNRRPMELLKHHIEEEVGQRRLAVLDSGLLGMVPYGVQPGDVIALLLGGEVPVALQPQGNNKYIYLGECYIHGLMDGEGFIEARRRAHPEADHDDKSWLQRLHEEPLPFDTEDFILV